LLTPTQFSGSLRRGAALALVSALAVVPAATAQSGSGGLGMPGTNQATVKGGKAKLRNGLAIAPESAPVKVKRAIRAANEIAKGHPYCLGGGHARWRSSCYDCSGAVSYAIGRKGARILKSPLPSGALANWGRHGKGKWITVYANGGHAFVEIAGLRFDTSQTAGAGPGWSENVRAGLVNGSFAKRHRGSL
jgi:hypothetical protein